MADVEPVVDNEPDYKRLHAYSLVRNTGNIYNIHTNTWVAID